MKFKLTEETQTVNGVKLFRIEYADGSRGGWLEKDSNLSQEGNARVSGNAQVRGNAWVSGNARVYGDAQVSGDTQISGDAQVSGTARVYGDARVRGGVWEKSPLYIQGSKHSLTNSKPGHLKIGCMEHPVAFWKEQFKAIGGARGYTAEEIEEYGAYIDLFIKDAFIIEKF